MRSRPATPGTPGATPGTTSPGSGHGDPIRTRLERRASSTEAEEALALYRTIFLRSNEAIAILDPDGRYLEQNAAHQRLLGYSRDDLRGHTPAIHLGEREFGRIVAELREHGTCRRTCTARAKDGTPREIELSASTIRNAAGEPVCFVGIKRDISEQRRAAAELRQQYDELQAIHRISDALARAAALDEIYAIALDALQQGAGADRASVLLVDDDGVMRFKAWRGLSDQYRHAVEGHSPWAPDATDPKPIIVPDVRADPELAQLLPVLAREGIGAVGFIPLVYAGRLLGKFMIYYDEPHEVAAPELRLAGSLASHIAFAITRARAEQALRDGEERYRRLIEQSPVAIAVYCDDRIAFVNSAGVKLMGARDEAELIGRRPLDFVHPDSRALVQARAEALARGAGQLAPAEQRVVRIDGSVVDVEISSIAFVFEGRPAVQVVAIDVTERRRNERAQRMLAEAGAILASSLDYAETLRSITQLVVPELGDWCTVDLVDDEGGFRRIAAAAARAEDQPIAARLLRSYPPAPDVEHGVLRIARTGHAELAPMVDDARLVEVARDAEHLALLRAMGPRSYICAPLAARGRTIGVLTFAYGASGRRYSEADLPLAEELARRAALAVDNARLYREAHDANRAKSRFLTTMSHELRTPLNAIAGYTELLQLGLRGPTTPEQQADLARIQRSQRHLLGLINDLLSFARIETGHLEVHVDPFSVDDALEGITALLEPQMAAKGLHYEQRRGDRAVQCLADRDRVQQIVLNLLSNAVKFTPTGGRIALTWEADAGDVRLHVSDTGIGIPATMLGAVFEPFVQIRDGLTRMTEGTGLGLAISRELARAMGGDVTAVSEPGVGSTFTVRLPRAPEQPAG